MSRFAFFTLAAFVLIGCSNGKSPSDDAKTDDGNGKPKKQTKQLKPFAPPSEVKLTPASPDDLKKFIADHKGQVVLVDYWATWCVPCKRGFPHTVALSRKHANDGLVVASVCLNATEMGADAVEFLNSLEAPIVSFGSSLPEDQAFSAFEIDGGALPHYKVFGPEGKLLTKIEGADSQKIDAAVMKALGFE